MNKKILGMGNAVLDIVSSVSDDFLASANLTKGAMTLVDQNVSDKILKEINPILTDFSKKRDISVIMRKKDIVIAKTDLDITNEILKIVDKKINKLKVN